MIEIRADGNHEPPGHRMVVDNYSLLIDLSKIGPPLVDPTILRVTWGMQPDGNVMREGGAIVRRNGAPEKFWDKAVLKPYLDAFEAKKAELNRAAPDAV